ncbi:MAG: phospho-N-acetylmuramoyl-pentapeptide-transferase [Acidimicrobiales bacterium]|nr:phospho-N-acetylmuramoyl-pentapeptide-transferase [Acidimicrobiia bacterium]NNC78859.1 phospho-N-acetylmuramoyl-pentapeptide-transferase [Acidimicrobiales bacterium]RZV45046.1 MAG: phospho-N-acetylmuramoyl-pentapeptide-transferase [Acidimicrobiales bacterium]
MIRLLIAAATSVIVSLVSTRLLIDFLTKQEVGQPIREDGPQGHFTKAGTPTMGGLAIVFGAFVGYIVADIINIFGYGPANVFTRTGLVVMGTILATGGVGFLDDWIKISRERSLGLSKRAKVIGLVSVAVLFAVLSVTWSNVHTELSFVRWDSIGFDLGRIGWSIWAILLILASANAVNLTDGLDGLASGAAILNFAGFTFIAFWAFRHPEEYDIPHALDLAVIAVSMLGGCVGFLWFNAAPAQIFMGDTGSLAIGAALAALALTTNTHLLLPIMGMLFVTETVSVILQVFVFKTQKGRRLFRMAPIHHHFELAGWPETRVIIRFWLLSGLTTGVGLGLFYWDSIRQGITA